MKKSTINFNVELDENNIPEKIIWTASDKPDGESEETKAVSIALWDEKQMNAMRIDLWTKEMTVEEMKYFYINSLSGYAQMILNSTGDEFMSKATVELCDKLAEHLKEEEKKK